MYNGWTIMDLTFPTRLQDEHGRTANAYQGTPMPTTSNLKLQTLKGANPLEAICNYYSAACDRHLSANLVALSYSQGFRRNKSRKRSSHLQSWRKSFTASQIKSIQKCCGSLVEENAAWCEVNLLPHSPPRKMIVKYLKEARCHNVPTTSFAGAQSALGKLSDLHA